MYQFFGVKDQQLHHVYSLRQWCTVQKTDYTFFTKGAKTSHDLLNLLKS